MVLPAKAVQAVLQGAKKPVSFFAQQQQPQQQPEALVLADEEGEDDEQLGSSSLDTSDPPAAVLLASDEPFAFNHDARVLPMSMSNDAAAGAISPFPAGGSSSSGGRGAASSNRVAGNASVSTSSNGGGAGGSSALAEAVASMPSSYNGGGGGSSSSFSAINGKGKKRFGRRLSEIIGADDRQQCPVRKLPYTAIGQIEVVDGSGMFICTGTLIAHDKVLTAGHCVWNVKRNAFYFNLNFAPGRYRQGNSYVSPYGSIPWRSVTVFDAFKKKPGTWDVAVVTLQKPVGLVAGTLNIGTGCMRNTKLTIAGYPQDRPRGSCTYSTCTVPMVACGAQLGPHYCDTVQGMSGAPLLDNQNRVRMIHIAGSTGRPVNQGTTMTTFLLNTINKW